MLKPDAHLPLLDMAWSRHKMAEFFNTRVLPHACPGHEVTSVTRERVTYEPGKQCAVLYSLCLGDAPEEYSRWAVVTFVANDSLGEVYRRHYQNGAGRSSTQAAAPAVLVPEHRCLVEFFPFDWRLPSLARALNPVEFGPPGWPDGNAGTAPGGSEQVKTLRYVPHKRCVFRRSMHSKDEGAGEPAVVKVYPPGSLARQTWSVLTTLQPQAMACGIIVPRPLEILHRWNLVLMEEAPGISLKKVLKRAKTREQAREPVARAAATLAAFHSFRLESEKVRSFERYLEFLQQEALGVHEVAPLLARQAQALLRQVAPLPFPTTRAAHSLIHGDFAPSQLLIAGDRVALVDFDNVCLGDPAMDVGNFMAKLHRRAVSKGQDYHRGLSEHFLAEYRQHIPDKGLEERARLYQALTLIRAAIHTFRRAPRSYAREGPASLPVSLLQEAAACLAT